MRPGDRVVVLAHAKTFAGMHGVVRIAEGRRHNFMVLLDGDTWPSLLFADEIIPEEAIEPHMVAGE